MLEAACNAAPSRDVFYSNSYPYMSEIIDKANVFTYTD